MMQYARQVLGKVILVLDQATTPKSLTRSEEGQKQVDEQCKALALYQFETCPFCVKVRRAMKRLNLNIELKDARGNTQARNELIQQGGILQVPCLRIENPHNGTYQWMYESSDIIDYLEKRFPG